MDLNIEHEVSPSMWCRWLWPLASPWWLWPRPWPLPSSRWPWSWSRFMSPGWLEPWRRSRPSAALSRPWPLSFWRPWPWPSFLVEFLSGWPWPEWPRRGGGLRVLERRWYCWTGGTTRGRCRGGWQQRQRRRDRSTWCEENKTKFVQWYNITQELGFRTAKQS